MRYIYTICTKENAMVATRCDKFFYKEMLLRSLNRYSKDACIDNFVLNNHKGLSENYNNAIEKYNDGVESIFIFMHDDVKIEDIYFYEKLNAGLEKYDIVGLAGTKQWKLCSPAVWNNCDRNAMTGAVAHTKDDQVWMTSFGNHGKALLLDGLFLAVKSEVLYKNNLRFDNRFTFHFYDLDFCLEAWKRKLSCGTVPIWVTHHSMGDWTKDTRWHELEKVFIEKWK